MANLKLLDIKKSYGKTEVVHGVDLEVLDGEFCVLVIQRWEQKNLQLRYKSKDVK